MKTVFTASTALLAFVCAMSVAHAQAYPTKPVRVIVGFPPGGGTDKLARLISPKLAASLGQSVVVENRPGAGGIVGTDLVAKAAPDGHTILVTTSSYAISAALHDHLPYDPINGLAPVCMFALTPNILVVHPSLPVHSVKELITFAKSHPGQLNYGSSGNGTPYHIAAEMFKSMAGVTIAHVPYKGAAPAVVAALSGEVALLFANIVSGVPQAKAGRLRALAVTTKKRSPVAPEIPTIAESGLPGYDFATWFGVLAPAGTPAAVVQRLNAEIKHAVATAEVRGALVSEGAEPQSTSPEEFAQIVRTDVQRFTKLAKQLGMRVD